MLVRIATLFAGLMVMLPAQDFKGARACANCHAKQYAAHLRSAHARALAPADRHPLADQFRTRAPLQRGPAFSFAIADGALRGSDGSNQIELPLSWAFGAGVQAVTFVARVNVEWYVEYFWSYYPKLRGFAPTPGQQAIHPKTLQEAAGLLYKTDDAETGIRGCIECHSTGPVRAGADRALEPTEPGVWCEACHGPGRPHAAAPSRVNIYPEPGTARRRAA